MSWNGAGCSCKPLDLSGKSASDVRPGVIELHIAPGKQYATTLRDKARLTAAPCRDRSPDAARRTERRPGDDYSARIAAASVRS